ncbi:MAG: TolB family protein, partial [Acidobacteriota bacterium]
MKRALFPIVLIALAVACAKPASNGETEPELHKVAEVDITGAISPDDRFLTYTDWSTGNLALRDLKTGEDRHLTNKGSWLESDEFALFSTISPDSKKVAYAWFSKDGFYDLRMIGADGSDPGVLYRDEELYPWPRDWSPDGKNVLATFQEHDGSGSIVLISVADGSVRVLKTLDWRSPLKMSFSPDGRYIAYDLFPTEEALTRNIYLISTDGNLETVLVEHPASDLLLGWTPDDKGILFASDRNGALDAWAMQMGNDRPEGEPELVLRDMGPNVVALGFDRTGNYYFGVTEQRADLYTAVLDPRGNRILTSPKRIGAVGIETFTDWSPDGQFLAYITHPGMALWDLYSWVLVIRSTE